MKFLSRDGMAALLSAIAAESALFVPAEVNGVPAFRPWTPGLEPAFDVLLTRRAPKDLLLPQCETYLTFEYAMEDPATDDAEEARMRLAAKLRTRAHEKLSVYSAGDYSPQVVFGLRPCDAAGIAQMDRVFGGYGGRYSDPFYLARREATALVGIVCAAPRSTCFCTSVGGSPAGSDAVDVLLTPVEDGFTAEVLSGKFESLAPLAELPEASPEREREAAEIKRQAEDSVPRRFELNGLADALRENFEAPVWRDLSSRCISCGTCTYVCPNCYCFNITDEKVEKRGSRFRTWDHCFNPVYTLETSGHNARDDKVNRFRNRFAHKYWYYPEKYGSLLCSGCGRCIAHCPTRIDIREVLRSVSGQHDPGAEGGA